MSDINRKLVTIRTVDAVNPIPDADAIEVATIGGWKVVVKKGEVKEGDEVYYFEIDSFLPDGNPAWQFLVDKQGRTFEGRLGHRLRTVKLRGQVSQGFIVPLSALAELTAKVTNLPNINGRSIAEAANEDLDLAAELGVVKWEAPLPAELAGQVEGMFPSFIRRTDQERCQNLVPEIFGYEDALVEFDVTHVSQEALDAMRAKMLISEVDGKTFKMFPAKADRGAKYEVTIKLDGSSCTFFHRDGEVGVCSRNLQLKVNDANKDNSFVRMLLDSGLEHALPKLGNIAIQGELMGPGIQGNREGLKGFKFFLFDAQLIDEGRYLTVYERYDLMDKLVDLGVNAELVQHAPVLIDGGRFAQPTQLAGDETITHRLDALGITDIKSLLAFAEGPSLHHAVREGLVFKRVDGGFSFKVISNAFLLKNEG